MGNNWTIGAVLNWTENYFNKNSISDARTEAELLLAHILDCPRLNLHINKNVIVPEKDLHSYKQLVMKRKGRKPLSYILGTQEFMGLEFLVNEYTLIPRPETELLTEEAIKLLKRGKNQVVADICTGSGCIAVSIAKFTAVSKIFATDLSSEALKVAYENTIKHNVLQKIIFKNGSLFNALSGEKLEGELDIVVSNPPYIAEDELGKLEPEIKFEPKMALEGGREGLDFYINIAYNSKKYLKKGAYILIEMNSAKSGKIRKIFEENGFSVKNIVKDYSGLDRVLIGKNDG